MPPEAMKTDASVFGKPRCLGWKTSVLSTEAKLERRPLRSGEETARISLADVGPLLQRRDGQEGNNVPSVREPQ